jgi:serine/threonine-protein kinase
VIADRYRVIDRLGHGGMATVFLAEDQVLSRQVAVKRLHAAMAEGSAQRFKREAQLGAALNHPNIVTVYDTLSGQDGVLIVMEYVPGQPLSELIGAVEPDEAIRILRDVARGLDHAHLKGVVHRDVKPANILLRDDGVVKLSDLGVATAAHVSRITATHDVLGTLGYIAPERLNGEAGGPPADVYSLAAVAFEVLGGQRPRLGSTPAEILSRSALEPAPDLREAWPHAPAAAAAILGRGLDPDPDRRPLSAERLIDELEAALEPAGATAPQGHTKPVTLTASSKTLLRATLVGALLAVAAGVMVLLLAGGGDESPTSSGPAASDVPDRSGQGSPESTEDGATATPTTTAPAPASTAGFSGAELNDEGYALIQAGRYEEAVPLLQRAVDSFPEGTTDLNYAYALFNLGNALRLAGRPEEAIPILEQRLEIPNQVETVARELAAAKAAAGDGGKPKKPKKPKAPKPEQ